MRIDLLHLGIRRRLPLILQSEAAECGLACLAMVLSYHGHLIDIATLRRRFTFSLKGITLAELMNIARQVDLDSRPLRIELEHLHEVQTPCILHWNMSHFVVLKAIRNGRLIIHDPGFGLRKITAAEASECFTGVVLELTPAANFVGRSELHKVSLRDVIGPIRGAAAALTYLFLFASFLECIVIAFPLGMQWVIDEVLVSSDHNLLTTVVFGFGLLVCFQAVLTVMRSWAALYFSTSLNVQWISQIFDHMLHIRVDFFERRYLGDLVSRFEAANTIQRTLSTSLVETLIDGLIGMGVVAVLFFYNFKIGMASVIGVALYAIVKHGLIRRSRVSLDEAITRQARQQGFLIETLRGIRAIKLGSREQVRSTMWSTLVASYTNARLVSDKLGIISQAANVFLLGLQMTVVIWIGASLVMDNKLSIGALFACLAMRDQLNTRAVAMVDRLADLRMLDVQANRVADITMEKIEDSPARALVQQATEGVPSVVAKGLYFRYGDSEPWLLSDADLTIHPQECVAITGPSGIGKSTLTKLIAGLLTPQKGEVRIGGISVAAHRADTSSMLSFVMQDDALFSGTLAENIHFFDESPDFHKVVECAMMAAIAADISAMPMRYDTLVGDMGSALSGGQKQRVLLARALYRSPGVLVLDEATSHLDIPTERAIFETLTNLPMTRIIIAHRHETLAVADRILVLHNGKFEELSKRVPEVAALNHVPLLRKVSEVVSVSA